MRIAAALLIVFATTYIGFLFVVKEKKRIADISSLEKAVLIMKNQISYLARPLAEILEEISFKVDGIVGESFYKISKEMEKREGRSVEEIWERVWLGEYKLSYFTAEDVGEIISFGKTISFLEREQKEGSIDLFLYYLREQKERITKRLDKNGKLYYSMGVICGLLIVIILV